MKKNQQLVLNISAGLSALLISMGIEFVLSPYIVESVGEDAYGFVRLSNNLVSYFSVLTIALNSMSSRFISVSFFQKDLKAANEYYASTFYANVGMSVLFLPVIGFGILNISQFLRVDERLVLDVQALMGFMAANFLTGLLCTNLGVSYYIRNKMYLSSVISIAGYILRAAIFIIIFSQFEPHICYIGIVAAAVTIFTQVCNIYYKHRLIPELTIQKCYFSFEKVKCMCLSGIWNSVTRVGSLLQEGLDLLITNLLLSPREMGILAIAKTIPGAINSMLNTLISMFIPNLTELYAKGQYEEMKANVKQSMKIIGMLINIPIALLIGLGEPLFELWFPTQDPQLLQVLSVLTIFPWAVMGPATIIHNIFLIVNKIRMNSLLVCATGLFSVFTVYGLLETTELGLFAVAGVSTVYSIIRNLCYTVPFGAIYIGCPWYTFFPEIGRSVLGVVAVSGISAFTNHVFSVSSWKILCFDAVLSGMLGLLFNYFIILDKTDRAYLLKKMKRQHFTMKRK